MALITVLTPDASVYGAVSALGDRRLSTARALSWERLTWLVRERPVTALIVDSASMPVGTSIEEPLRRVRRLFPSAGVVFLARPEVGPSSLFRLGRAGISDLTLLPIEDLGGGLRRALARAGARSTSAFVTRAIGMRLPVWAREVVRAALDGAALGWGAEQLATASGWTRPHLSVRLRSRRLPSAGRLLIWAKLLHAGRWLTDPGRSAESVSRQLEYSSGAAFRRALRNYLGATPTDVVGAGGYPFVLDRFLDVCGLGDSLGSGRSVA